MKLAEWFAAGMPADQPKEENELPSYLWRNEKDIVVGVCSCCGKIFPVEDWDPESTDDRLYCGGSPRCLP